MCSSEVVPGDVLVIDSPTMTIPADCALVRGRAVMNESALTGEPMPVQKFPIEVDGA